MTEVECEQVIFSLINNLIQDGFNIKTSDVQIIEYIDSDSICGYTQFVTENTYRLCINRKLLKEHKFGYLQCVVYHELAHIIQYNEAIAQHLIKYNEEEDCIDILYEDVYAVDELVFDNFHHTGIWIDVINQINTKYNLVPKITTCLRQTELNKFLEGFFMNERRRPNDPVIDYTISGLTIADMMKYDIKPEYRVYPDDILKRNKQNNTQDDKDSVEN